MQCMQQSRLGARRVLCCVCVRVGRTEKKKNGSAYSTIDSRVVTHRATKIAVARLDSVSGTGTVTFECIWP
jgi:hypothetical protein